MSTIGSRFFALFLCAVTHSALYAETTSPLWLSDSSPHAGDGKGMQHAHSGPVEIRRGIFYKHLWLRLGDPPSEDALVVGTTNLLPFSILDTHGKKETVEVAPDDQHGVYHLEVAMPEEGFYNVYVQHELVIDDLRELKIAKAEFLKHSCRAGHDDIETKMVPRSNDNILLELVRERLDGEDFHTLQGFGDTVSFILKYRGKPVSNAEVTMITQHGWRNTIKTDMQGRAGFTLIRDYYPPWNEFKKRHAQNYLVKANYVTDEVGKLDGAPYTQTRFVTSYYGSYYPSARDYNSYAYGLSFGLFAFTLTGAGIYFYRRRRNAAYREVRFDEKD